MGMPENTETTAETIVEEINAAGGVPAELPPAEPPKRTADASDNVANLIADVRGMWANDDATALAIAGDLADPTMSPQLGGAEERDAAIRTYREHISNAIAMREELSSLGVWTAPAADAEHAELWGEYSDAIHAAHAARAAL